MRDHEIHTAADAEQSPHGSESEPTSPTFDRAFWEQHWQRGADGGASMVGHPPNPHLIVEIGALAPGRALDAGCGAGAEALWLAAAGWQVTATDISAAALAHAAARAATHGAAERITWLEADLTVWEPDTLFDLVTSFYAHAAMPQLALYERLGRWVQPGGTLLLVGHGQGHGHHTSDAADHQPSDAATVSAATIAQILDPARWSIITADERTRVLTSRGNGDGHSHNGRSVTLHDVVVRAVRLS